MNIIECGGQRSAAWFDARLGKLTSSRISAAIGKAKREKTGELQARKDLKLELAVERITGRAIEHYTSGWMERGTELEPLARAAYELRNDLSVELADFVAHPWLEMAGCSPDGYHGKIGVEIKVPKPTTHAQYILADTVPEEYRDQCYWQMAVCDLQAVDFVSYCAEFPHPLDLFIVRLPRDNDRIAEMNAEATKFLGEVEAMVLQLKGGIEEVLRESLVPKAVIPPLMVNS